MLIGEIFDVGKAMGIELGNCCCCSASDAELSLPSKFLCKASRSSAANHGPLTRSVTRMQITSSYAVSCCNNNSVNIIIHVDKLKKTFLIEKQASQPMGIPYHDLCRMSVKLGSNRNFCFNCELKKMQGKF